MKTRTVFVACLAGLMISQLLSPIFTDYLPGSLGLAFRGHPPAENTVILFCALSALIVLGSGYVAARLEWASSWRQAAVRGFHVGSLAGCLAYMLSGAAAAGGVLGQKEILLSLEQPIASESAGIGLLILGVVNASVLTQLFFWAILLPAVALGALGGLLSRFENGPGWFGEPAPKNPDLERVIVYSFGLFGLVCLILFVVVMTILPGKVQEAILQNNTPVTGLLAPPDFLMLLPLVTAAACLIPSLTLAIKWAFAAWKQPSERLKVKIWLGALVVLALLLLAAGITLALAVIGLLALIALLAWLNQRQKAPTPPASLAFKPYSPFDYLASGLAQGILCGTLPMVLSIAYALALVLIAVTDITYLTMTGAAPSTAREEVQLLYTTLGSYSLLMLLGASAIGLIGVILSGVTGLLRSQPPQLAEVSNLGDE